MFAIYKDNCIEVNMADFLRWLTETGKIAGFSVPDEGNDWCKPVVYEFTSMADEGRAPASSMQGTKIAAWYNRDRLFNYVRWGESPNFAPDIYQHAPFYWVEANQELERRKL